MSMKKWRESVSEKAEVERQNESILAAIKNNKIKEELGQLSGEKLFKPITSRLDTRAAVADPRVGEVLNSPRGSVPDYGMDEFDLINPFDGDFNPDAETPTPTPTPTPSPTSSPPSPTWGSTTELIPQTPESTPLPPLAEEEETELATPKTTPKKSKWGSPKPPGIEGSESVDLQTLNSMLTKNKDNPDYVVKSPKSKFHGYTMADIKAARDEILIRRGITRPSEVDLLIPRSDLSRSDPDWEQSGSGTVDPNALVEQLHLSLASIRAGNTSLKLKKQVEYMLGFLKAAGEITQKEVHNILRSII